MRSSFSAPTSLVASGSELVAGVLMTNRAGSTGPTTSMRKPTSSMFGAVVCAASGASLLGFESRFPWFPFPLIALVAGIAIGRVLLTRVEHGARFAGTHFLRAGIVLLGFRLSLVQLQEVGSQAVLLIIPCVLLGGSIAFWVACRIGLGRRVSVLLAAGTAICGISAVAAVAPRIGAEDDEVAASVMSITFYGTAAMILFPLVAGVLSMSNEAFGLWAGTAINDTSQVVAAAFSFSDVAGESGTIVKLARNIAILPAVLIAPALAKSIGRPTRGSRLGKVIPWFVFAFVGAVVIATVLEIPAGLLDIASLFSKGLILAALTGIGIGASSLNPDREVLLPLAAGALAGICLALASFALVRLVIPS